MKRNWREVGEGVCMALAATQTNRGPSTPPTLSSNALCSGLKASGLGILSVCRGLQLSTQHSICNASIHDSIG